MTQLNKSLLIVGGGFIGRSLVDSVPNDISTVLVTRYFEPSLLGPANLEIAHSCAELDPTRQWDKVIYCAGPSVPGMVTLDDVRDHTLRFSAAIEACGHARCFIYVSSGGMLYNSAREPHRESDPVDLNSSYATLHCLNEKKLNEYYQIKSRLIFRLGNPFGRRQEPDRSVGYVTQAVRAALTGRMLQVQGAGDTRRDFFHISSFIDLVMSDRVNEISGCDTFNFGCGSSRSLIEVIYAIQDIYGRKIDFELSPSAQISRPIVALDTTKLKSAFPGFLIPGLEDGLVKLLGENTKWSGV